MQSVPAREIAGLHEVVRDVVIADRGEGKSLQLRGLRVERRFDDRAKHRHGRRLTPEAATPRVITGRP